MNNIKRNIWKVMFLSLVSGIIIVIIIGAIWLNQTFSKPSSNNEFQYPVIEGTEGATFTVSTTKRDLNYWLQQELGSDDVTGQYHLYLDDFVYMETVVDIFGLRVPIEMRLTPMVTDEGNIEVQEESFHLAGFELSSERVFQLINSTIDLPDWITVMPEDQQFYINVRDGVSEEFDISVNAFDLEEDNFEFEITIIN